MRRLFKRTWRVLFGALAIFWLAYTVAYFKFNDHKLGRFISNRVSKVDRGTFHLGYAHYPYWGGLASLLFNTPAHVVGEDFTLLDPDGNTVIVVPRAEAHAHLQELLTSLVHTALSGGKRFYLTLHFSKGYVASGFAVIAPTRSTWGADKSEVNIVAAMSPRKKSESTGGDVAIRVDEAELGDVAFGIGFSTTEGKASWSARLPHAHATAGLLYSSSRDRTTSAGPYFFFALKPVDALEGDLLLGEYHFPLRQIHAVEFGSNPDKREELRFSATAKTLNADVKAAGALLDAYSDHAGVQLALDVEHGRQPLALLPPPLSTWLGGDPRAHLDIVGRFTQPLLTGEVHELTANLEGIKLAEGYAKLKFENGLLTLHPASGRLAHGQAIADVDVELKAPGRWSAAVQLRNVDPGALDKLPRAVALELAGKLDARVKLTGNLITHPERIELSKLAAELTRSRPGGKLPRKLVVQGALEYTPAELALRNVSAEGDGVTLLVDGKVDPRSGRLDASVKLDSNAATPLLARLGAPAALRVDGLHAAGRVSGALTRPQLTLHAQANNISYQRRTLEKLEADLTLRGGTLVVEKLTGSGLGAQLAGQGELALFDVGKDGLRPRATPTVRAELTAHGLSLSALTGWLSVAGDADVALRLEGPVAHPHGYARLSLPKLSVQGDVYSGGRLDLAFDDDGATIEALSLRRQKGGSVGGSGKVSWGGELELRLEPKNFPLAAIPWIQGVPIALAGTLSGDVTVGGNVEHPILGGLISLVQFKVREALLGNGTLKLDPGADAIHIHGNFFGNVTVDGYITMVPKVSVVATIGFTDLALERFYPEILQLAEVRGLASGEARVTVDSESGFTFAALKLSQLKLTLNSIDENGRPHKLIVKNQNDVLVNTDGRSLDIKRANLYSAIGDFTMRGVIGGPKTDVSMNGRIGLELLEYFFRGLFEHTHGPANLELSIKGDLMQPQVNGWLEIGGSKGPAELVPRGLDGKLRLVVPTGRIEVTADSIKLRSVAVSVDGRTAQASGQVALSNWQPGAIKGTVSGDLSPKLFQWWRLDQVADAAGAISVNVAIGGVWDRPEWHGRATVKEPVVFRARKLERDLRIDSGTIDFNNFDVAVGCPRGGPRPEGCKPINAMIDEQSKVAIDGTIGFGEGLNLRRVDLHLSGSEIAYHTSDYSISFSPHDVTLTGDGNQLTLRGAIDLVEGRYSRGFDLVGMVFKPKVVEAPEYFWQGIPLLETMRLSVHAQSTGPLIVKNNIAELTLSAALDISGTLSDPHLDGSINVDEGGRFHFQLFRYAFTTDQGSVRFDEDKKIPSETPTIDLNATSTDYYDRYDQQHTLWMKLTGTALSPRLDLGSLDGMDRSAVLQVLLVGQSADDIRKAAQGAPPALGQQVGAGSATDTVAKTFTGATVGQVLGDPLKRVTGFDTVAIEFGGNSFDVKLCKRQGRYVKMCGQGEVGFAGSSRFGGSIELRIQDWTSAVGRIEYLTRGIETLQDSLTSGRGEFRLRIPLGF